MTPQKSIDDMSRDAAFYASQFLVIFNRVTIGQPTHDSIRIQKPAGSDGWVSANHAPLYVKAIFELIAADDSFADMKVGQKTQTVTRMRDAAALLQAVCDKEVYEFSRNNIVQAMLVARDEAVTILPRLRGIIKDMLPQ